MCTTVLDKVFVCVLTLFTFFVWYLIVFNKDLLPDISDGHGKTQRIRICEVKKVSLLYHNKEVCTEYYRR